MRGKQFLSGAADRAIMVGGCDPDSRERPIVGVNLRQTTLTGRYVGAGLRPLPHSFPAVV